MPPLIDCHVHTVFSVDAKLTMVEACQEAARRGLKEIAFTEHFDCNPGDHGFGFFQPDAFLAEISRCRQAFATHLTIRAGIEVGEPHVYQSELRDVLEGRDLDLIIGAIHWVDGETPTNASYFEGKGEREAFEPYFAKVYEMASVGNFDVLAHLDIPKRKATDFYGPFHPKRYEEVIRAILGKIVEKGIALEINSSGLRSPAGEPCPGLEVIRWYRELDGELVTICSDAHRPGLVGDGLEHALRLAHEVGLKSVCTFVRRTPKLLG